MKTFPLLWKSTHRKICLLHSGTQFYLKLYILYLLHCNHCHPHERFFNFERRSALGSSVPTWLRSPGRVFLKRHVSSSKYEPLVDEVELIHATPSYAHVRLQNGRETTVSLRDIAPITRGNTFSNELHLDPVDRQAVDQGALKCVSQCKKRRSC